MQDCLTSLPSIRNLLDKFPKTQWKRCLQSCIVLGVQAVNEQFPQGSSMEEMWSFARMEEELRKFKRKVNSEKVKNLKHVESKIRVLVKKDIENFRKGTRKPQLRIPGNLKEPKLRDLSQTAKSPPSVQTHEALKIADSFLSNPFTSHILDSFSGEQSPSYLKIMSPENKFMTNLEMFSSFK